MRGAAQVVQQRHVRPRSHRRAQTLDDQTHRMCRAAEIDLLHPRLTVDAKAQFRLARADPGLSRRTGNRAGVKRHPDRDRPPDHPLCRFGHLREVRPAFGQRPRDLVDKERARHTPGLRQMRQGHVIIDDHHRHLQPEGPRPFRGKAEVQPVAGVVLDDQQAARLAGHREDAREHRIHRGRGKDVAADGRRQHARPDKARMCRLVP